VYQPVQKCRSYYSILILTALDCGDNDSSADNELDFTRIEDVQRVYKSYIHCDCCGKPENDHYYYYIICEDGNFDLCGQCFSTGAHCYDTSHHLIKLNAKPGRSDNAKDTYYTNPGEDGHRRRTEV
jgi:hypothetical protein